MNASVLIAQLRERGFALSVTAGSLRVRPRSRLTPEEREAIGSHLPELIATLTVGEPWDQCEALRLMEEADALVGHLGVDGRHPAIADAAAMVVSAHVLRDMETLR